jgi:nicotinamidase-related amidase
MSSVIDLRTYVGASNSRLLVMIDLQQKNYDELAKDRASDLRRSLENCLSAIQHARNLGLPIAFTRQGDNPGLIERSAQSAWISGLEPKRSDMVFERPQPSCYTNQMFEDVVSRIGNFAIAGLVAEETCLATAIDASHRGHHITFLSDASVSRARHNTDSQAVHSLTTKAIELFADTVTTRHWLVATSPRSPKGHRYG